MGRLIIIAVLIMIVYFTVKSFFKPVKKPREKPDFPDKGREPSGETSDMVQDPECGTYIPIESAERAVIKGVPYYFCSEECRVAHQKKLESGEI